MKDKNWNYLIYLINIIKKIRIYKMFPPSLPETRKSTFGKPFCRRKEKFSDAVKNFKRI